MASAAGMVTTQSMWPNETKIYRGVYDFASDGGTQQDYDVITFGSGVIMYMINMCVYTAPTSLGAATVGLQIDGTTDIISAQTYSDLTLGLNMGAELSLSEAAPNTGSTPGPWFISANSVLNIVIGGADLTAGKLVVHAYCIQN